MGEFAANAQREFAKVDEFSVTPINILTDEDHAVVIWDVAAKRNGQA